MSVFQDLLVSRLASEVSRLLTRGIHRTYLTRQDSLSSPRGRLLFSHLAREPLTAATFHPRTSGAGSANDSRLPISTAAALARSARNRLISATLT